MRSTNSNDNRPQRRMVRNKLHHMMSVSTSQMTRLCMWVTQWNGREQTTIFPVFSNTLICHLTDYTISYWYHLSNSLHIKTHHSLAMFKTQVGCHSAHWRPVWCNTILQQTVFKSKLTILLQCSRHSGLSFCISKAGSMQRNPPGNSAEHWWNNSWCSSSKISARWCH